MFKSLLDEHQAKQTRLKEEVGTSSPFPAPEPIEPRRLPAALSSFCTCPSFVGVLEKKTGSSQSATELSVSAHALTNLCFAHPRRSEVSRRSALNAVSGLTESLVDTVNGGVVEVFETQKQIEEEARELQGKCAKFAWVTGEWVRILQGFDKELREIGDFENWIKSIEFDLNNLTGVMEYVAEGGAGGGTAGEGVDGSEQGEAP